MQPTTINTTTPLQQIIFNQSAAVSLKQWAIQHHKQRIFLVVSNTLRTTTTEIKQIEAALGYTLGRPAARAIVVENLLRRRQVCLGDVEDQFCLAPDLVDVDLAPTIRCARGLGWRRPTPVVHPGPALHVVDCCTDDHRGA